MSRTYHNLVQRAPRCVLIVLSMLSLCGIPPALVQAIPVGPRGYTWMLSPVDFAAGEFAQTAFVDGQLRSLDGRDGSYTTPAHRAPFPFTAVGMDWQADLPPGAEVALELRLSRDGQAWEAWQPVEGEPQDQRWFGENLVMLEAAWWMQARLSLRGGAVVSSLTLTAIDASGAPGLEQVRAQASPLTAASAVPAPQIISRAAWGADESLMTWDPEYAPARKMVIHHTVTSGGDNPVAEVQAIYYYHAITRGWGDIGYNYLVDKYGNIYEGRSGGLDVIAGHTYGYNVGSVGIGNLGDYSTVAPTASMLESNAALAAWYGERNFIHPGESSFFVDMVTPNITGHRDYATTSCPGGAFYAQLPALRARAWGILRAHLPIYAAAFLSHDTPQVMLVGATVEVRHTLRNAGTNTWYRVADPNSGTPYHLGYHWYDSTGAQVVQPPAEDHRTALPGDVSFGSTAVIPDAALTAPHVPGNYTLKWDMVHEGVTWFATSGNPTLDIQMTVTYPATLSGMILDNRAVGVSGAQVALADGPRVTAGANGNYAFANLFPGTAMLQAYEPGNLHFPNGNPVYDLALRGGESAQALLVLLPFDNVVHNGGFEAGLSDWIVTGFPTGDSARASTFAHTGRGSVELSAQPGQQVELKQIVRLPAETTLPTLSLMVAAPEAAAGGVLNVLVETPGGVVVHTLPLNTGWSHWWTDVAAAPGELVTLTVRLQSGAGALPATVFLDEVTLGSGGANGWRYQRGYLPLVLRERYEE
ncbi:MAG: N-acetylmuramoyl-L-alanine amidase [Chloroflexi bacterium ADurb.Bin360]|nr:MAG: N-acetylmuramoyl-L-alanine amidase [Chloroflexi bacterium ADurb.Bin360]